jgi:alpha-D-ribose 1-methylphosphonate 5-triphosphate synthase subunit PhnH
MDALARPGRPHQVPAFPGTLLDNPYLETVIRTLLDQNCGFAVPDGSTGLAARVGLMTSALPVCPGQAHFAIITAEVLRTEQTALMEQLPGGSALAPEQGATAIVECLQLSAGEDSPSRQSAEGDGFLWQVTGPGVELCHHFASSEDAWFAGRTLRHDEFPCGIDLILVDRQGKVVGLPRTAQVSAPITRLIAHHQRKG